MAKRFKMSKGKSKRLFSKTAAHVNAKNLLNSPMRGGFRM